MKSLTEIFNKKKSAPSSLNDLFSLPPTSILQPIEEVLPVTTHLLEEERQYHLETPQARQEMLERTIFMGNVKIGTNKADLKNLLKPFGVVESIWYRSVPVEQSKMGPKACFILKKFQQNSQSLNAYARFQDLESAQQATELNGKTFNGLTLRVTRANDKEMDFKKTVFIGNLPYDVKEEELRLFLSPAGKIENVRVIRDKFTHQGKGMGYVKFSAQEQMKVAIKDYNGKTFKNRSLRIKRAVQKKRLEKKLRKFTDQKDLNKNNAMKRINQKGGEQPSQLPQSGDHKPRTKPTPQPQTPYTSAPKQAPKKTPQIKESKPRRTKEDDEEDQGLKSEVSKHFKALKRKMIQKKS